MATSDYPTAEVDFAANYVRRDVVSLPGLGWAKLRFVADNPGERQAAVVAVMVGELVS